MTKSIAMIVAGTVGSSETRLGLCGLDAGRPVIVVEETLANKGFSGLAPMVQRFLQKYRPPQVRAAAFVVGGPIHAGASLGAHLPWVVGAQSLATELSMDRVTVLSDADGIAHALPALAHEELASLNGDDAAESGNQAVLGIGSSAGVAGLYWNGTEHRAFSSEGASTDFAPRNAEEAKLAAFASAHVERLTVASLISRAGLALVHAYVEGRAPDASEARPDEDSASAILREAKANDGSSRRAVDVFLGLCGSVAGNLALSLRATGGVYLGGDLVVGLRDSLENGRFKEAFVEKAPLQGLLKKVPVTAILNPNAALLGAATVAARELRATRGSGWAS